jgi:hypothetical protein
VSTQNKMTLHITCDGRQRAYGARMHFDLRVHDEQGREVALVEFRRQPDNEISMHVYGVPEKHEALWERVLRRGKDRRRHDHGGTAKLPVNENLEAADGAW